jgi:hypothetical protein
MWIMRDEAKTIRCTRVACRAEIRNLTVWLARLPLDHPTRHDMERTLAERESELASLQPEVEASLPEVNLPEANLVEANPPERDGPILPPASTVEALFELSVRNMLAARAHDAFPPPVVQAGRTHGAWVSSARTLRREVAFAARTVKEASIDLVKLCGEAATGARRILTPAWKASLAVSRRGAGVVARAARAGGGELGRGARAVALRLWAWALVCAAWLGKGGLLTLRWAKRGYGVAAIVVAKAAATCRAQLGRAASVLLVAARASARQVSRIAGSAGAAIRRRVVAAAEAMGWAKASALVRRVRDRADAAASALLEKYGPPVAHTLHGAGAVASRAAHGAGSVMRELAGAAWVRLRIAGEILRRAYGPIFRFQSTAGERDALMLVHAE